MGRYFAAQYFLFIILFYEIFFVSLIGKILSHNNFNNKTFKKILELWEI
jgi:hypothetical protein